MTVLHQDFVDTFRQGVAKFRDDGRVMVEEQNAIWAGERSCAVAAAIRALVPPGLKGMDYGCGPGHIGLRLADHFMALSLVDASPEVVSALAGEVAANPSLRAYTLDLTREAAPERVDCVFASMSFHHVIDTSALLEGLARTVRPDGWVVVADFDADDGELHSAEPGFDGHHGFNRQELAALVGRHGFVDVRVDDLWSGQRWAGDLLVDYSLFLLIARSGSRRRPARPQRGPTNCRRSPDTSRTASGLSVGDFTLSG